MAKFSFYPIQPRAGIRPSADTTVVSGSFPQENGGVEAAWTEGSLIRFANGFPQTLGGTEDITITNFGAGGSHNSYLRQGTLINGTVRSLEGFSINGGHWVAIGTTEGLFVMNENYVVQNITPLKTATTAIANSIATQFDSLANNPIATTNGSFTITISHTTHGLRSGDSVTIGGAATTNGVPNTDINGSKKVTVVNANSYTVQVATAATSTGSGGGASVTVGTGRLRITHNTHGFQQYDRVKIAGATDTGGHLAANINMEFALRAVTTNTYDVYTDGEATSAVTGGGGAATTVQGQIDVSDDDYPTFWSFGKIGEKLICCPGNRRGVYEWAGATGTAPTQVGGTAPTMANWIGVHNGKLYALAAWSDVTSDWKANRFSNARSDDYTDWSVAPGFDAYEDIKEEADELLRAVSIGDRLYLFTPSRVMAADDIGGDDVWRFKTITANTGIIGPAAAFEVDGQVYFIGNANIYRMNGDLIQPMVEPTVVNVAMEGLTNESHIGYIEKYKELYFFDVDHALYHSHSLIEGWWTFGGGMGRTAVLNNRPDLPFATFSNDTLITYSDINASGQWDGDDGYYYLWTNWRSLDGGKTKAFLRGVEVGGHFDGTFRLYVDIKDSMQANDYDSVLGPFTVTSATNRVGFQAKARYWRYRFEILNGASNFARFSGFKEIIQRGSAW